MPLSVLKILSRYLGQWECEEHQTVIIWRKASPYFEHIFAKMFLFPGNWNSLGAFWNSRTTGFRYFNSIQPLWISRLLIRHQIPPIGILYGLSGSPFPGFQVRKCIKEIDFYLYWVLDRVYFESIFWHLYQIKNVFMVHLVVYVSSLHLKLSHDRINNRS